MPDVAREILAYFVSQPQAVDDLRGIAQWRLARQRMEAAIRETHAGLEWLRERGYLFAVKRSSAGPLFHLNPERAAEAAALINAGRREKR